MDVNVLVHQIIDLQSNQAHAVVYFCPEGLQLRNRHRNQGESIAKKIGLGEKLVAFLCPFLYPVVGTALEEGKWKEVYFEMFRKQGARVGSYLRAGLHLPPSFCHTVSFKVAFNCAFKCSAPL